MSKNVRSIFEDAGGFAEIARRIGASRPETVRWWAVKNRVPPAWIPRVAIATKTPESFFWALYQPRATTHSEASA